MKGSTTDADWIVTWVRPVMLSCTAFEMVLGGLPDQEWPLRVTQIYRRDGSEWQLLYRHADPLVHRISLEQAALLARG
jgi:hypothetical protein